MTTHNPHIQDQALLKDTLEKLDNGAKWPELIDDLAHQLGSKDAAANHLEIAENEKQRIDIFRKLKPWKIRAMVAAALLLISILFLLSVGFPKDITQFDTALNRTHPERHRYGALFLIILSGIGCVATWGILINYRIQLKNLGRSNLSDSDYEQIETKTQAEDQDLAELNEAIREEKRHRKRLW